MRSCELPFGSPGCLCSSQKPSGKGVRRIFSLTAARVLRRGLQESSPCRGCHRVMGGTGRGPAHRPAGEGAATWQLAQLGGLEVPPPPGSHGGTGSSQGREAPLVLFFFFSACPVLSRVLITAAGGLGRDTLCTRDAEADEVLGDLASLLSPGLSHFPERVLHLPLRTDPSSALLVLLLCVGNQQLPQNPNFPQPFHLL